MVGHALAAPAGDARTRFMPGSAGSSDVSKYGSSRIPTVPCVFAQSAMISSTAGSLGSTGLISPNRPGCAAPSSSQSKAMKGGSCGAALLLCLRLTFSRSRARRRSLWRTLGRSWRRRRRSDSVKVAATRSRQSRNRLPRHRRAALIIITAVTVSIRESRIAVLLKATRGPRPRRAHHAMACRFF